MPRVLVPSVSRRQEAAERPIKAKKGRGGCFCTESDTLAIGKTPECGPSVAQLRSVPLDSSLRLSVWPPSLYISQALDTGLVPPLVQLPKQIEAVGNTRQHW